MIEFVMYLAVALILFTALLYLKERIFPEWRESTYFAGCALAALVWPLLVLIIIITVIVETAKEKR